MKWVFFIEKTSRPSNDQLCQRCFQMGLAIVAVLRVICVSDIRTSGINSSELTPNICSDSVALSPQCPYIAAKAPSTST